MKRKVVVTHRWIEPPPVDRHGKPIPRNQWPRMRRRSWVVRWYSAKARRLQRSFRTKQEAEPFAASRQAEFDRDPAARRDPAKVTLKQFIDEVETLGTGPTGRALTAATVADYRLALTKLADFLGHDTLLVEITPADAARFSAAVRTAPHAQSPGRRLSPATANKIKRTAKAVLNIAVRQLGYLVTNPFTGQRQDHLPDRSKRYVPAAEFASLAKAIQGLFDPPRAL